MKDSTYEKRRAQYKSISDTLSTHAINDVRRKQYLIQKKIQDSQPESIRNDKKRQNLQKMHFIKLDYVKQLDTFADELILLIKEDLNIDNNNNHPDYRDILSVFNYYETNIQVLKQESEAKHIQEFFSTFKLNPYLKFYKKCLELSPNMVIILPDNMMEKARVPFRDLSKENIEVLYKKLISLDMQNNEAFKKANSGLYSNLCQYIKDINTEYTI